MTDLWLESLTKIGIGGVVLGSLYIVTPLFHKALDSRKNGNGSASAREALREVLAEQAIPAITKQTDILERQTNLLTRLVTLQESRERRGE
jgi:hypothetical protein